MEARELAPRLLAIVRAPLPTSKPTVQLPESLEVLAQRLRRFDDVRRASIVDDGSNLEAEIDADDVGGPPYRPWHDRVSLTLDTKRNEPAICAPTNRRRQNPAPEAVLGARFLEADAADHRQPKVTFRQRHLVETSRVSLAFPFEARESRPWSLTRQAHEEPIERAIEVDECLLANMRGHVIEPGGLALL
jgi:hypothetical protein